jgi:hypothetical protein
MGNTHISSEVYDFGVDQLELIDAKSLEQLGSMAIAGQLEFDY